MSFQSPDLHERQKNAAAVKKAMLEKFRAKAQREKEELEALIAAEEVEKAAALAAQQKADRDARYAARKAAKKVRRRGY